MNGLDINRIGAPQRELLGWSTLQQSSKTSDLGTAKCMGKSRKQCRELAVGLEEAQRKYLRTGKVLPSALSAEQDSNWSEGGGDGESWPGM